ncbi:MAG: putative ABC transporter permease [Lachnospiraceae bacterium]
MKKYIHNFIHCGILGWCMEITFTALNSFRRRQFKLTGNTSIWMFPIYGCACFLAPVSRLLKKKSPFVRGLSYAALIFTGEFITGTLLNKKDICPWDYSRSKWHIKKIIRLDYLPFWFMAGLLFERLISEDDCPSQQKSTAD